MVGRCRRFRPIVAVYAAFLAAFVPTLHGRKLYGRKQLDEVDFSPRRLEVAVTNSDEFAESVLTLKAPKEPLGMSLSDHEKITSVLKSTMAMVDTARLLIQDENTFDEGQEMMEQANSMFREVKQHIMEKKREKLLSQGGEDRALLRRNKYSGHDVQKVQEEDDRGLDVARSMYEMMVTFPECVNQLISICINLIESELSDLGLSEVEIITNLKRNETLPGYHKVVIVTNELADRVAGRAGDGMVEYPFRWNDAVLGPITLGVDGKWNCMLKTPDECCQRIKDSVDNPDVNGNEIDCHIFIPFGGLGNPRLNDRIIVNLSPDGRVHEAPILQ